MIDLLPVPPAVAIAIAAVYGVLAAASLALLAMRRAAPDRDLTELRRRTTSWWVIVTIVAVAVLLDRGGAIVLLAFVSFLALKEYLSLIPTRRADRRVLFWCYLAIPLQYLWVYLHWYGMFIVFIPVWVFLFLPLRMITVGDTGGFLRAAGTLHWGLMLTVFAISHAAYLLSLPRLDHPASGSVGLLLSLVILTALNDVAQYCWGKAIGGPRIVPKVSPGKTWAGFLGGVATTAALGAGLAPLLTPFAWPAGLAGGAIVAVAGFVGDVTVSALKRDLGIKDSGSVIPGHGGILDRVDSLTFSAPVFFHAVFFAYYGPPILS